MRAFAGASLPPRRPAAPPPHPSGLAKGSTKGGRPGSSCAGRSSTPSPRRRTDPPEHPTSFPLQFYQRPGSRAGDRRPALTRISPEIAGYAGPGSGARSPPSPLLCVALRLPPAALTLDAPAPGPASLFAFGHIYQTEAGGGAGLPPPQGQARAPWGRQGAQGPCCSSQSPSPSEGRGSAWEPRGARPVGTSYWGTCLCVGTRKHHPIESAQEP